MDCAKKCRYACADGIHGKFDVFVKFGIIAILQGSQMQTCTVQK